MTTTTTTGNLTSLRTLGPWALAIVLGWVLGAYATRALAPSDARWATELIAEKLRAAQARSAPGILVVGGSGTHFGVDCGVIEAHAGVSCFNLGSHAGVGVATLVRVADQVVRPGDLVVLRFEHAMLAEPDAEGALADAVRTRLGISTVDDIDGERDLARALRAGSPGLRALLRGAAWRVAGPQSAAYDARVDERGDPRVLPSAEPVVRDTAPEVASDAVAKVITSALARWRARGISAVLAPPIAQVEQRERHVLALAQSLAALRALGPVLVDADGNLSTSAEDFADSPYHLAPSARARASLALAGDLRSLLETRRLP